jgi:hypothetical protein
VEWWNVGILRKWEDREEDLPSGFQPLFHHSIVPSFRSVWYIPSPKVLATKDTKEHEKGGKNKLFATKNKKGTKISNF